MKPLVVVARYSALCILFLISVFSASSKDRPKSEYPISFVGMNNVKLEDSFWYPTIERIQKVTIPHCLDTCIREGRLENFLIAGGKMTGKVRGKMPFDDTDIYKIIEGASYSLLTIPNKELESYLDSIIAIIKIGQEPDGYLTTWFTIDPYNPPSWWAQKVGKRWLGEASNHELYNSGHLFEAAVAHYLATGKRNLLEIAIKNADLLVRSFGYGKLTIPPGHQIVETGLIKLYRVTGKEEYLRLAKFFLDIRGDSTTHPLYGKYSQDHMPILQQKEVVGHAVRAMYMYAGMTDVAALFGEKDYFQTVQQLWNDMVEKKTYITGGIGSRHDGESFGDDYELPNDKAYCETCASIGSALWNARLFMLTGEGKYMNLFERVVYNGVLAGISLDGKNFFYVNPLEANGNHSRQPWFECACCPTNLIRFLPTLPGFIYAVHMDTIYINLFVTNTATIPLANQMVHCEMRTEYPWKGTVNIRLVPQKGRQFAVKIRVPAWLQNEVLYSNLYRIQRAAKESFHLSVNGMNVSASLMNDYVVVSVNGEGETHIQLQFPMEVLQVNTHERVKEDKGKVALEYGPFVYCAEGIDHTVSLDSLILPKNIQFKVEYCPDVLGGISILRGDANYGTTAQSVRLTAIPYYCWNNRGKSTMKVWLQEQQP